MTKAFLENVGVQSVYKFNLRSAASFLKGEVTLEYNIKIKKNRSTHSYNVTRFVKIDHIAQVKNFKLATQNNSDDFTILSYGT